MIMTLHDYDYFVIKAESSKLILMCPVHGTFTRIDISAVQMNEIFQYIKDHMQEEH